MYLNKTIEHVSVTSARRNTCWMRTAVSTVFLPGTTRYGQPFELTSSYVYAKGGGDAVVEPSCANACLL